MKISFINTTLTDHGVQKKSDLSSINSHCSRRRRANRWSEADGQPLSTKSRWDVNFDKSRNKGRDSGRKDIITLSWSRIPVTVETPSTNCSPCISNAESSSDSDTGQPVRKELSLAPVIGPLLRLAIETNAKEKNLLKFWLVTGRRYTYRTSSNPRYCPGLASAMMLAESPVYVQTLLIIGEMLQRAISGKPRQPTHDFYQQRGRAYQAMNKMLNDQDISIYVKLISLTNLGTIEYSLGRCDVQTKHLEAISTCVELYGGVARLEPQNAHQAQQLKHLYRTLWMNLPCFMQQKNAPTTSQTLDLALSEFMDVLREVRDWVRAVLTDLTIPKSTVHASEVEVEGVAVDAKRSNSIPALSSIRTYLNWLIDSYLAKEMPFTELTFMVHTLQYIVELCRLQVRYSYTASQSVQLLLAAEQYMIESTDPEPLWQRSKSQTIDETAQKNPPPNAGAIRLHPIVAMGILFEIRDGIVPSRTEVEFQVVKCYSRIYKLITFLSRETVVSLGRKLAACALGVVYARSNPTDVPARLLAIFDEEQLEALEQEVRMNWVSAQGGSPPPNLLKGQSSERIKLFSSSWIDSLYR